MSYKSESVKNPRLVVFSNTSGKAFNNLTNVYSIKIGGQWMFHCYFEGLWC